MKTQLKQEMGEALFGDATLYIGLMAAFDVDYREHLVGCIDCDGKLWRNPEEADARATPYPHGVSRDMLAGAILGLSSKNRCNTAWVIPLAGYIRDYGRLSENPDSRSDLRLSGWVAVAHLLRFWKLSIREQLGWRGVMAHLLFGWTEGLVDLLSSCTPQRGYQRHLVLVSLLTRKKQGRISWFDRWTLRLVDYCLPNNPIVWYLQGSLDKLEAEYPHHVNRARNYAYEPLVYPWAEENFRLAQVHMGEWPVKLMRAMMLDLRGKSAQLADASRLPSGQL